MREAAAVSSSVSGVFAPLPGYSPLYPSSRSANLNLRHNERIQLGSVVAAEFAARSANTICRGVVVRGARLHPFFEVVEGGRRTCAWWSAITTAFAGGVKGALPVQRLEHGQDLSAFALVPAHTAGAVGEGGGIQRLRAFAPER